MRATSGPAGGSGNGWWTFAILSAALAARLAFVAWAPARAGGDDLYYRAYGMGLAAGSGYVEFDGSPAIQWMPGWPLFLAGLYAVVGTSVRVGMIANAALGAATAAILVPLGTRLFRAAVGRAAGALYAIWPGVVYFTATLMTEVLFSFLLVASLALLAPAVAGRRRAAWCSAAGIVFGLASLVKAETLALTPVLLAFVWYSLRTAPAFARSAAPFLLAVGLVLAPWVARNHLHFDRILITSAAGGMNVWLGNHDGARGGEMIRHIARYMHAHAGPSRAQTLLNVHDSGWSDALAFVLSDPAQELQILTNKLRLTYTRDDGGVAMIRGPGAKRRSGKHYIGPAAAERLSHVANGFWYGALLLVAIGLGTLRSWLPPARVLVLGIPLAYCAVHLVFLGGARFHVGEIPALALIAGCGVAAPIDRLRRGLR